MPPVQNNRVMVVDDHTLTAEMTAKYLGSECKGEFEIEHTDSLDGAMELVAANGPYSIILLDVDMPGMQGMRGVERMIEANSPGYVVLFSGQVRFDGALRAIEIGAKGYIPKTLPLRSLANAIRFVSLGEIFLPPSIAKSVRKQQRGRSANGLSETEIEIVRGITKGHTNKDIARDLGLSEVNVKMHVRSICAKLNVTNRTQVAMTAMMRGLA